MYSESGIAIAIITRVGVLPDLIVIRYELNSFNVVAMNKTLKNNTKAVIMSYCTLSPTYFKVNFKLTLSLVPTIQFLHK